MGKTRELILIHQEMKPIPLVPSSGFNIMLTPQFYTIVREALPVKYAYEAKRIAPSLFEGLLEEDVLYHYFVEKEEDTWLFIAYSDALIAGFLSEKGMTIESISKVYFAEQSLEKFTLPMALGSKEVLMNLNDRMTILPKIVLDANIKMMHIDNSFIPKKGIRLALEEESLVSSSDSYTVAAICILFASIYVVEASRYGGTNLEQEKEIQVLLENAPALESSYTRDSILSKYRSVDTKERMKREIIKSLSRMIFKGSLLMKLSLDTKKFQATFKYTNKTVLKRLKELAKEESFSISLIGKNNLKIEGTL